MLTDLAFLLMGFVLLAKGADSLVEGGATLATKLGINPWVVGLTVVAWGTSLPEVVVSTLAALDDKPGVALDNVLGSNVANAGLVLGTVGLILPRALVGRLSIRESLPLLLSLAGLYFVLGDGEVTRVEGGVMLAVFVGYTLELILFRGRGQDSPAADVAAGEAHASYPWLRVILGALAILAGARLVLLGATGVAESLGLKDGVVGLLILALGTSLPDLAAGVVSARKGHTEIGLGNIVGSNVFNTLAVVGVAAVAAPFGASATGQEAWAATVERSLARDFPVNVIFSLVLVLAPTVFRGRAARLRAGLMLGGWLSYILWINL